MSRAAAEMVEDIYVLSPMQQGMLFHSLAAPPGGDAYFRQIGCQLEGDLRPELLREAWQRVIDRHAALRTVLVWEGRKEPLQVVYRRVPVPWTERDLRDDDSGDPLEDRLERFQRQERERGFSLSKPPLLRLALLRFGERRWRFVWSYHHAVIDGWSVGLVLREVFATYEALCEDAPPALGPAPAYGGFIAWLRGRDRNADQTFWRRRLAGFAAPNRVVPGAHRTGTGAADAESRRALPAEVTARLAAFAGAHRLTLATVVQGAWARLLALYGGDRDVVFGVTVSGRPAQLPDVEETVGVFINTLPLRVEVRPEAPVVEWLRALQAEAGRMREHDQAPLVDIQGWSEVPRGTPLFESLVVFENLPFKDNVLSIRDRLNVTGISQVEGSNYPMALVAGPGRELGLSLLYDADRLDAAAAARRLAHLARLLTRLADGAERVGDLSPLSEAERAQLLVEWNPTLRSGATDCLHRLFGARAESAPERRAVVCRDEHLSYGELARRSRRLARHLRSLGVGPEVLVALYLERSLDLAVAILAVLEAGGAYLPLDPVYPRERLAFMLRDSGAAVVVTRAAMAGDLPPAAGPTVRLDADAAEIAAHGAEPLEVPVTPGALAYVIYTSGSTGRPKGTLVSHANVSRLFAVTRPELGFDPEDVWSLFHSPAFDFSVWELWGALLYGGTVVMVPTLVSRSPDAFLALARRQRVTVLSQTPTAFLELVRWEAGGPRDLALRWVVFGGEALDLPALQPWFERHGDRRPRLVNMYGITETTVHVTFRALEAADVTRGSVIGAPLADLRLYVAEDGGAPLPVEAPGELLVGGAGLSRGYLGRPGLTAQRFVPNPFPGTEPGARLYRTGDLARRLADGDVEYLGRIDQQVKIRGFRIELGEIEAALAEAPEVLRARVLHRPDGRGEKRLVAYLVARDGGEVDLPALRGTVARRLPDYMVPSSFVVLDALPVTAHGKLDVASLPEPAEDRAGVEAPFVAPRTPVEEAVAAVWEEVLGCSAPGIADDFFELGGHSLLATRVVSRLARDFGVELTLRAFFEEPTIAHLARSVEDGVRARRGLRFPPIERVPRDRPIPLSFAQRGLWILDRWETGDPAYNIPVALRLEGSLDVPRLQQALTALVARHEVLRTSFGEVDGEPVQRVAPPARQRLPVVDLQSLPAAAGEDEMTRLVREHVRLPFDLEVSPLYRVLLVRMGPADHVAALSLHHIVSDGWSMEILVRELSALYAGGQDLPELPAQYADFSAWQRRVFRGEVLERQLEFWRSRLVTGPSRVELPADRPPSQIRGTAGGNVSFRVPDEVAEGLVALSRAHRATVFMTLLAAFDVFLSCYGGDEEVVVGSPIAGRDRSEVEGLIGYFVNTMVLRTDLSGDPTFVELLARVRETVLDAWAHRDMPFDLLVSELQPERDARGTVFFNVLFAFQDGTDLALTLPDLKVRQVPNEQAAAFFDLTLDLIRSKEGLRGRFNFRKQLFDAATVEALAESFVVLLEDVVAQPEASIHDLRLVCDGPAHTSGATSLRELEAS